MFLICITFLLPRVLSQGDLVEYYYYWKKTNAGLTSRNTRRQRKMAHIRMVKTLLKPPETTPEREYSECVQKKKTILEFK